MGVNDDCDGVTVEFAQVEDQPRSFSSAFSARLGAAGLATDSDAFISAASFVLTDIFEFASHAEITSSEVPVRESAIAAYTTRIRGVMACLRVRRGRLG
jgi:hypothetical protein